jgi:hypothetical protein
MIKRLATTRSDDGAIGESAHHLHHQQQHQRNSGIIPRHTRTDGDEQ